MADTAIVTAGDVTKAKAELERMKRSLAGWLKYRRINDAVAAGTVPTKKSTAYAKSVVTTARDWDAERRLAKQLFVLLSESFPNAQLPDPDVDKNAQAAVQLATIAIHGPGAVMASAEPQGVVWLWPVLIIGGLLLAITTAIKTAADVAKEKEHNACIAAGACTDYGFWLKAGGVTALVYVAWQVGLGERVRKALKG